MCVLYAINTWFLSFYVKSSVAEAWAWNIKYIHNYILITLRKNMLFSPHRTNSEL